MGAIEGWTASRHPRFGFWAALRQPHAPPCLNPCNLLRIAETEMPLNASATHLAGQSAVIQVDGVACSSVNFLSVHGMIVPISASALPHSHSPHDPSPGPHVLLELQCAAETKWISCRGMAGSRRLQALGVHPLGEVT